VWYAVLGKELSKVSPAFAEASKQRPEPWKMGVVIAQGIVIASVISYIIGVVSFVDALQLSFLLWLGLAAMQWVGSMVWEKVPLKMAAIHGGDWLVKLLIIGSIVGVWQ
jgi:hypothetical protein